jgi:hypothetical protein
MDAFRVLFVVFTTIGYNELAPDVEGRYQYQFVEENHQ